VLHQQGHYAVQKPVRLPPERGKETPKTAPTSDRIPGPASADDFMYAHKWKRGAGETEATVKEIRRKASKIAPAYNKGALQYLPDD
jgi:hypothetical protein